MMEERYQVCAEELDKCFNTKTSHFDERFEDMEEENKNTQRAAGLQRQAQQPRLAVKADVKPYTKTRERMEGAARYDKNYGDNLG